jgi:hypothetical protein
MKSDLSPRDLQGISSYLDGQLSLEAQARLDERLRNEQDLRAAFESMQRTRALLRSQPRLRAPHNFTLTREMMGKRPDAPAYPVLGLVSALASLLFIVLLVGDLLNQRTALAPAQIASQLQAEATQFGAAGSLTPGADEASEAAQAPALEPAPNTAFASTEAPLGTQPPSAAAKMLAPQPTQGEITATTPVEQPAEAIRPPSEQAQQFGAPASSAQDNDERSSESTALSVSSPKIFGLNQNFWHGLEILAAILAIATGLAWWIGQRRL